MSDIDTIIQKYIQKNASEEESQLLYKWIQQSPGNKNLLFAEKDIWDSYGFQFNRKNYEINSELELLKKQIATKLSKRTLLLGKMLQMAAMILVAFGLGWASHYVHLRNNQQTAKLTM